MTAHMLEREVTLTTEVCFTDNGLDLTDVSVIICGPRGLRIPVSGALADLIAGDPAELAQEARE